MTFQGMDVAPVAEGAFGWDTKYPAQVQPLFLDAEVRR